MGLQPAAGGHVCKLRIYSKNYTIIQAVGLATYCYLFICDPASQPAVTGVAICRK